MTHEELCEKVASLEQRVIFYTEKERVKTARNRLGTMHTYKCPRCGSRTLNWELSYNRFVCRRLKPACNASFPIPPREFLNEFNEDLTLAPYEIALVQEWLDSTTI